MAPPRPYSVCTALLLLASTALGQSTWTGAAGTSWSNPNNWSPVGVPGTSTDVIVPSGGVQPSTYLVDPTCRDLTIATGASMTLGSGFDLTVTGNLELQGTLAVTSATSAIEVVGGWVDSGSFVHGNGEVELSGTGTLGGSGTAFSSLTISGGTRSATTAFTAAGDVTVQGSATLDLGSATHIVSGNWNSAAPGATVSGAGKVTFTGTGLLTTLGNALPNVEIASGVRSVNDTTVSGDLTMTGGQLSLLDNATLAVDGDLLLSGGTLDFVSSFSGLEVLDVGGSVNITAAAGGTSADTVLRVAGNWTSSSAFAPSAGVVEFDGAGAGTIDAPPAAFAGAASPVFANLHVVSGTRTVLADTLVSGNLSIDSGASLVGGAVLDVDGDVLLGASASFDLGTLTHTVAGDWSSSGGSASGAGSVAFDGSGSLVTGGGAISNVRVDAGVRTALDTHLTGDLALLGGELRIQDNATLEVDGDASFTGGVLAFDDTTGGTEVLDVDGKLTGTTAVGTTSGNTRIFAQGDWSSNATFAPASGFVILTGGPHSVSGAGPVFPNLVIAGGTIQNVAATSVQGNLTILAGATLDSDAVVTVAGGVSLASTSTWDLGSDSHPVGGDYVSAGGDATGAGRIEFNGAGVLSTGAGAVAGVHVTAGIRTVSDSTVTADASMTGGGLVVTEDQTLSVGGDLVLTGGVLHMLGVTAVAETIDVAGAVTLSATAGSLSPESRITCSGDWSSTSAFTPTAGTVLLDGGTTTTLAGASPTLHHLVVLDGTRTVTSALGVGGDLTLASGAALVSTAALSVTGDVVLGDGSASWDLGAVVHDLGGSYTSSGASATGLGALDFGGTGTLATGGGSIANLVVSAGTLSASDASVAGDLTLSGGTLALTADATLAVGGDALLGAGTLSLPSTSNGSDDVLDVEGSVFATATVTGGSSDTRVRCAGDWNSDAAFVLAAGRVELDGAGPGSIGWVTPGDTLALNDLKIVSGDRTLTGLLALTGDLDIASGATLLTTLGIDVDGDLNLGDASASLDLGALDSHTLAGHLTSTGGNVVNGRLILDGLGTLSTGTGAVDSLLLTAGLRQVIDSTLTGDLELAGGELRLLDDQTLGVAGDVTLGGGVLSFQDLGLGNETLDVSGNVTQSATTAGSTSQRSLIVCRGDWSAEPSFAPAAGTVSLEGAALHGISGTGPTFANLRVRDGVRQVLSAGLSVSGDLSIQSSGTFEALFPVAIAGAVSLTSLATFDTASQTHTVGGDWATFGGTADGGGVIEFTGDGTTQTNAGSLPSVLVSAGNRVMGDTTVTGQLELSGGSLIVDDGATLHVLLDALLTAGTLSFDATPPAGADELLDVDGSVLLSCSAGTTTAASTLRCGGDLTVLPPFSMAAGTVVMDGAPGAISGSGNTVELADLRCEGPAPSHSDALHLSGDLTIATGSQFSSTASSDVDGSVSLADASSGWFLGGLLVHTVAGDYASGGGDATGPGTVEFDGDGLLDTGPALIASVLVSSGLRTALDSSVASDLEMTGGELRIGDDATLTVGGALDLSGGTLSFERGAPGLETLDVEGAATLTCASGATSPETRLLCAGDWSSSSNWAPTDGLVVLDGVGARQIGGSDPFFHDLQLTGGPRSVPSPLVVSGELLVDSGVALSSSAPSSVLGSVDLGDGTCSWDLGASTHLVSGDWTSSGGSATGAGTVEFTGPGLLSTGVASVANVTVSAGQRDVRESVVAGLLTLNGGSLVIEDDQSLTVGGDAHLLGGTFGFATSAAGGEELLDVAGSAIVTAAAGDTTIKSVMRVAGDWSGNASFAPTAGRVELVGVGFGSLTGTPPGLDPTFASLQILSGDYEAGNDLSLGLTNLTVASGASFDVTDRDVTIPSGLLSVAGELAVGAGGSLSLGPSVAINVSPTGTLRVVGSGAQPAVVSDSGGNGWLANVNGTLAASNFRFEGMGASGLVVTSGATLAPFPADLRGGVFADPSPLPSSVLLDLQRAAPTELRYVDFEDAGGVGSFNLRCFSGSPITMMNSSGGFSGSAFEHDPFGLVSWGDDATQLSQFVATAALEQVTLGWTSTVETDLTDWVLTRASSAGGPYTSLTTLPATGPGAYQHVDGTATGGTTWYYRLSQRLTHGQDQLLANTHATPWSSELPPNMTTVGPGGDHADVQSAITALVGQALPTVVVAPGTYPAFTVGPGMLGTLRILGDGTGPVLIDTSSASVLITGLSASESVELSDLIIGDPASPNAAVVISGCSGVVVIDECVLDAGPGAAGASLTSSSKVSLQRSTFSGDPGLALDSGSVAIAGKGGVDEVVLSNGSDLRLAEMGAPSTSVDGTSSLEVLPGVHADLDLPELASLTTSFPVTLSGTPNGTAALLYSLGLNWIDLSGARWEMVGLVDLGLGDILITLPLGPSGSLTFPTALPASGIFIGIPVVLQTVVINPADLHRRWSNVAAVIGVP